MEKTYQYNSDEALVQDLRNGFAPAFEALYRKYFRMVAKQVADSGYRQADATAEDLFQEVLIVLVRKIREPEFNLSAKLSTYLFAVARNLLSKKTGGKFETVHTESALENLSAWQMPDELSDKKTLDEQLNIVVGNLQLMDDDCQQVLNLSFYEKRPQSEIASIMGYSDAFVKVKKHRCLEYLRKQVKAHPLFERF